MAIIKCPECGHQVSDKAPVCPYCGVEIAGKTVRCPQCGEVYFKDQSACPICHQPNPNKTKTVPQQPKTVPPVKNEQQPKTAAPVQPSEVPTKPAPADEKKPANSNRATIIVALVLALIIMGALFYFYKTSKDNKEQEAYEYALKSDDPQVLQQFLDQYPDADEEDILAIKDRLAKLKATDQDWTDALVSNSKSSLEAYLDKYPDSPHKQEALHKIDSLDWDNVMHTNTVDAYQAYLEDHPNGEHVDEANDGIKKINAKTVQPEEKQVVASLFRKFFQSLNSKNEENIMSCCDQVMSSFLGKVSATRSDAVTFMHKIWKADVSNMNWRLPGDYQIKKKEVGDNEYEYNVVFSAQQEVEKTDKTMIENKYTIKARVNPNGLISEFNMTRIIE